MSKLDKRSKERKGSEKVRLLEKKLLEEVIAEEAKVASHSS
jgi:hypothetical protein